MVEALFIQVIGENFNQNAIYHLWLGKGLKAVRNFLVIAFKPVHDRVKVILKSVAALAKYFRELFVRFFIDI